MTTEMHPQMAEALRQAQRFQSAIEDQTYRTNTESLKATDQAKTVSATVNGRYWLTGLRIEEGLLRLGANTVEQRVNEALLNARAAATAAVEAEREQLAASLIDISGELKNSLGLS
jgi:DNA-binding protein YbaB